MSSWNTANITDDKQLLLSDESHQLMDMDEHRKAARDAEAQLNPEAQEGRDHLTTTATVTGGQSAAGFHVVYGQSALSASGNHGVVGTGGTGGQSLLARIKLWPTGLDTDIVDRLTYHYTSVVILVIALLVAVNYHFGNPIHCLLPKDGSLNPTSYPISVCWMSSTYYNMKSRDEPSSQPPGEKMAYYHWAYKMLILQALLLSSPYLIWRLLMNYCGFDAAGIMQRSADAAKMTPQAMTDLCAFMAKYLDSCIRRREDFSRLQCGRRNANFLVMLYFFFKWLQLLLLLLQLIIINRFIGSPYVFYGFGVLLDLFLGNETAECSNLPKVVLCDFGVGNSRHRYTVNCALPTNAVLARVFAVLWLWHVMQLLATFASIAIWLCKISFYSSRQTFIAKHLSITKPTDAVDVDGRSLQSDRAAFVNRYLRIDLIFVMRLIELNSGGMVVDTLVKELWKCYQSNRI